MLAIIIFTSNAWGMARHGRFAWADMGYGNWSYDSDLVDSERELEPELMQIPLRVRQSQALSKLGGLSSKKQLSYQKKSKQYIMLEIHPA